MLSLNSKLLVRILIDIRRALALKKRSNAPVHFHASREVTTIRCSTPDASIACQLPISGSFDATIPMSVLAELQGSSRQDVRFCRSNDDISVESRDSSGNLCTAVAAPITAPTTEPETAEPTWLLSNQSSLGTALFQAASIADPGSSRYSLACIRLRGSDGQIAATDGRQAFVSSGFALPVDEVLVSASVLSSFPNLTKCTSISIGRAQDLLSIRCAVGPQRWIVDLRIVADGRFPNVDQCFPSSESARTELRIAERDAQFMMRNLKSLLGKSADLNPITLELTNDRGLSKRPVQLRFRKQGQLSRIEPSEPLTEIALDESDFEGLPKRVAMNADYLLTALLFGFRTFQFQLLQSSVYSTEGRKKHVFLAMHESLALQPVANMRTVSTSKATVAA